VNRLPISIVLLGLALASTAQADCPLRGNGDLGLIVERASDSVQIVDTTAHQALFRVTGLGDLSHAPPILTRSAAFLPWYWCI
jgi:protein NirF